MGGIYGRVVKRLSVVLATMAGAILIVFNVAAHSSDPEHQPGRTIRVEVSLAEHLQQYSHQPWTLYVFAKPVNGRVPLASAKLKLNQLPLKIELTEKMFLLEHLTLANAEQVIVAAKATRSNDPHRTAVGDLIASSDVIHFSDNPNPAIRLEIDTEVSVKK